MTFLHFSLTYLQNNVPSRTISICAYSKSIENDAVGKQQHIGNFYMLMEILRLYFLLCYRPELLVLSFWLLSFIYAAFSCINGQSLCSKRAFSWAERAWSKNSWGLYPQILLFLLSTKGPCPPSLLQLEPPLQQR